MKQQLYTAKFKRDIKRLKKSGKNMEPLKKVMNDLVQDVPLESYQKDHKLLGKFKGHRECHVQPDWLLIYELKKGQVTFERTGSHSELFG